MLINPLQLAVAAARVASGRHIVPRLLRTRGEPTFAPIDVSSEHIEFVRRAMGGVVHAALPQDQASLDNVQMAGKTGTAQVRRITMSERAGGVRSNESLAWKMRDHSLFMGFARSRTQICGRRDHRAWRVRRAGRGPAGPRHSAVPVRPAEGHRRAENL